MSVQDALPLNDIVLYLRNQGISLDGDVTLGLSCHSIEFVLDYLQAPLNAAIVVGQNPVAVGEIVAFLDRFAGYHGHDGPSFLSDKFPHKHTCPDCFSTPVLERLRQCVMPGNDKMLKIMQKLLGRLKKKGKLDNWLPNHLAKSHYICCRQSFSSMDSFIEHVVDIHKLEQQLKLPKNVPPPTTIRYLERLAPHAKDFEFYPSLIHLLAELKDGHCYDGDGMCLIDGKKSGHNTRFCNKEGRQRVAQLLSKKRFPQNFKVEASYRCIKSKSSLPGSQEELACHQQNCKLMTTIVAIGRMLLHLVGLKYQHVPVGSYRIWWMAFSIVAGKMDKLTAIRFPELVEESDDNTLFEILPDTFPFQYWRDVLVDMYEQELKFEIDGSITEDFPKVTMGPLFDHAKECARNESVKLRQNLYKQVFKLVRARLSLIRMNSPFLKRRGMFTKVLAALKSFICRGVVEFDWSKLPELSDKDVAALEEEVGLLDDEYETTEDVEPEGTLTGQLNQILVIIVQEILRNVPLCRLVDTTESKGRPLPPPLPYQRYLDSLLRQEKDKDKRELLKKTITQEKFNQLPDNVKQEFAAPLLAQDFHLWHVVCTQNAMNQVWTAPEYSYITIEFENRYKKGSKWKVNYPKYVIDDKGNTLVEWSDTPFVLAGNEAVEMDVAGIIRHLESGSKGMPGVSSTLLWNIYKDIGNAIEQYNNSLPVNERSIEYSTDPVITQDMLDNPPPHLTKKPSRKAKSKKEKMERLKEMGVKVGHEPKPIHKRARHLNCKPEDKCYCSITNVDMNIEVQEREINTKYQPRSVKLSSPLLDISFSPIHFYFDWDSTKEFYQKWLQINLPKQRSFETIFSLQRVPILSPAKSKINRWSTRGPVFESQDTTSIILGFQTDGFDFVCRVIRYRLVPKDYLMQDFKNYNIDDPEDCEIVQKSHEDCNILDVFDDPGRRDIHKFLIDVKDYSRLTTIANDPSCWNRLDQGIITMDNNYQVQMIIFQHKTGTTRTQEFKLNMNRPFVHDQSPWETGLKPGKGYLMRGLPLKEYYRICGFDKDTKIRKQRLKEKNNGISMEAVYKSLPSFKTFSLAKSLESFRCRLKWLIPVLEFEHGSLIDRSRKLLAYHRKSKVQNQLANDLVWNPITKSSSNKSMLLFQGSANFSHNSRGLRASPSKTLKKLLQAKTWLVPVNEYNTSKNCSVCRQELSTRSWRRNDDGRVKLSWGVKFCIHCGTFWNRDLNACLNIGFCGLFQVYNHKRPPGYHR